MYFQKIVLFFIVTLSLVGAPKKSAGREWVVQPQADPQMNIFIGEDADFPGKLQVTLENSIFKAVIRVRKRKIETYGNLDHCIRDWILKSMQQDQVENCIDGSALRPLCTAATIVCDSADKKSVRLIYGNEGFVNEYSIFPNSPVVQVDYISYCDTTRPGGWINAVDIATPGGITERFTAETRVHGQEEWVRPLTFHEFPYWSIHHSDKEIYQVVDEVDAGSLNYKDHLIMAVGNPENGTGFGRIMPLYQENARGGVLILKLLWDVGFEPFFATGQDFRPTFTGYLFLFMQGLEEAIEMGKHIVDGDRLIGVK